MSKEETRVMQTYDPEHEVAFEGIDPTKWRDHPEPPGMDDDNDDVEGPTPQFLLDILGFDPDVAWKE